MATDLNDVLGLFPKLTGVGVDSGSDVGVDGEAGACLYDVDVGAGAGVDGSEGADGDGGATGGVQRISAG